jgi:hypothetical protein
MVPVILSQRIHLFPANKVAGKVSNKAFSKGFVYIGAIGLQGGCAKCGQGACIEGDICHCQSIIGFAPHVMEELKQGYGR